MRLTHQKVMGVKRTRAGFTLMEVLLALTLTLTMVGLTMGAVMTFSRANTTMLGNEELERTAIALQEYLRLDLGRVSRTSTFRDNGSFPDPSATLTRLALRNPITADIYHVTYEFDPEEGTLERHEVGSAAPNPAMHRFHNIGTFSISQLMHGQVSASGVVRERLDNAGIEGYAPRDAAGQQVPFRVTGQVRMR